MNLQEFAQQIPLMRILHLRGGQNLLCEGGGKLVPGAQVGLAPDDSRQFQAHGGEGQLSGRAAGFELHKDFQVLSLAGFFMLGGNKEPETQDMPFPAELGEPFVPYAQPVAHKGILSGNWPDAYHFSFARGVCGFRAGFIALFLRLCLRIRGLEGRGLSYFVWDYAG